MPNGGSRGDYYTTKGMGSQEAYDAYYEDYGNSAIWGHLNVVTQSNQNNVWGGGSRDFVTTGYATNKPENNALVLLAGGILAYNFLL